MADIDYWELIPRDAKKERENIDLGEMEIDTLKTCEVMLNLLHQEVGKAGLTSRIACDAFWDVNQAHRDAAEIEGQQRIGTRVRVVNKTLSMEWYRNRFAPGDGSKKSVFSTHLSRGKGLRYHRSLFQDEPDWSREVVEYTENVYANERLKLSILKEIRKHIKRYERLIKKESDGEQL